MPKFYVCSAGKRDESYAKENFERIVAHSAYILDEKAEQKGPYNEILPGSILFLKYNGALVAYGKAVKSVKQESESWNLWVVVERWFFKNEGNEEEGVTYDGLKQNALTRSNYSAIKEVTYDFGWQKLQEIDSATPLYQEIKNSLFFEDARNDMKNITKLLEYKKQIILQGPPGTGKTHTATKIAEEIVLGPQDLQPRGEDQQELLKDQLKLIQFHPAYSYEDFVRGITVKTNGVAVEYRTENKILADFASKALVNYLDSKKEPSVMSNELWAKNEFEQFIRHIEPEFENDRGYLLNDAVSIFDLDDDGALRYSGHNWIVKTMHRMKVSDVVNIYLSGVKTNAEVKKLTNVSGSAKQHATYYLILANHFGKFVAGKKAPVALTNEISEKKFILIIDEINRANLAAVLGELIYALEYREESVETMYDIDGERSLRLPPNLYIIGTMNTADRSVGHIDYAIRRRFAFVDVLPSPAPVHTAAKNLFKQVSELFVKDYDSIDWQNPRLLRSAYIASDFHPEDIWIGHSYFMSDKEREEDVRAELEIKLKYEILPLLKEYVRDGLLLSEAEEKIKSLYV